MRTASILFLVIVCAACLVHTLASPAHAGFKKTKIAVLDFQLQGEDFASRDMGKIVAEWLITGLVETGRFDVIERRLLEKVLAEQKLGVTGAIDPNSAAQLGKVLGVKTIVSGALMSIEGSQEINARLINVDTASIVAAETARSRSAEGLRDLVTDITGKIALAFPLEGYVVQRDGSKVTVDLGRQVGVRPGMQFIVFREGRVIKHPRTGEVLEVESIETGLIEIRDVRDKTASGVLVRESALNSVVYGSMVRSAGADGMSRQDEEASDWEDNGEGRGLIPIPRFFRRGAD